jgi:hypothetical protein
MELPENSHPLCNEACRLQKTENADGIGLVYYERNEIHYYNVDSFNYIRIFSYYNAQRRLPESSG